MNITDFALDSLLKSFPVVDLYYEIIKKDVPPPPLETAKQMSLHIPVGPKYFAWFSTGPLTHKISHGIYLLELNRQKRIASAQFHKILLPVSASKTLFHGTLLYGTWIAKEKQFVIEDIYFWKGQNISVCLEKDKWHMICALLETILPPIQGQLDFGLRIPPINTVLDPIQIANGGFHHVQFRQLIQKSSYINYIMKLSSNNNAAVGATRNLPLQQGQQQPQRNVVFEKPYFKSMKKPQYAQETVFRVVWDSTGNDLYKLYAYGSGKTNVFYDYACVQDTQTSFDLKQIFGKSTKSYKRNANMDYLEESDSEDDEPYGLPNQEQTAILIRCRFHTQFKKWIPIEKVAPTSRVVHISYL